MALAAVNGATLHCNYGTKHAPFACGTSTRIDEKPVGNISDATPGVNIFPFGTCKLLKKPCVPMTDAPWFNASVSIFMSGLAVIELGALLPCQVGGLINILSPGQGTVDLAAEEAQFHWNLIGAIQSAAAEGPQALSNFFLDMSENELVALTYFPFGHVLNEYKSDFDELKAKYGEAGPPEGTADAEEFERLDDSIEFLDKIGTGAKVLANSVTAVQLFIALGQGKPAQALKDGEEIAAGVAAGEACEAFVAPAALDGPAAPVTELFGGITCGVVGAAAQVGVPGLLQGAANWFESGIESIPREVESG